MLHNYKVVGMDKKSAKRFMCKMDKIRENPYSKLFYHHSRQNECMIDFDILCSEQVWHDLTYFIVFETYYYDFYLSDTDILSTNT